MPTIHANGINIYYETHGEGEPLVLIPGLATDVSEYAHIIAAFAKRYKVIAIDNRGAGRTDKPDIPYSTVQLLAKKGVAVESLHEHLTFTGDDTPMADAPAVGDGRICRVRAGARARTADGRHRAREAARSPQRTQAITVRDSDS